MKKTAAKNIRSGECFICHESIAKAQITRHLGKCIAAQKPLAGEAIKMLRLQIEGRYLPDYWMQVAIPGAWTLDDLDSFMRETWLECCGHLSCFTIDGTRYAYEPFNESILGRREKSMDVKLYKVLGIGAEFTHEYDYGSTTDLVLRVVGAYEGAAVSGDVQILARNNPFKFACVDCGKPAKQVNAGYGWLDPKHCYCTACAKKSDADEGMWLPIVNSPRVGVCGYCGDAYDECTEDDV